MRRAGIAFGIVFAASAILLAAPAGSAGKKLGSLKTRTATASATGHQGIATATATCPKRTRATAGGFLETTPTATVFPIVYESQKVGQRSWRVSAQQDQAGGPPATVNLTTYVYCRSGAQKTTTAATTVPTPASVQAGNTAIATCPAGRRVQAGGFSTPPPVASGSSTPNNRVYTSQVGGKTTWQVLAFSQLASSVTSYGYCAKDSLPNLVSLSKIISGQGNPTTTQGATSTATAACTGKALAAGFSGPASVSPLSFQQPYELQLVGTIWRASGIHVTFGGPQGYMIAAALCH